MAAERPDVDALADLDAGLVDGAEVDELTARRLRGAAAADPAAAAVLDALAATRAELAAAPRIPVPPAAAARWAEPAAGEVGGAEPAPQPPAATPLPPRQPRRMPRAAVAAAAALVVVAVVTGIVRGSSAGDQRPEVSAVQLAATALAAQGVHDAGGLDDAARRGACLRAAVPQVRPDALLLGAERVRYEGRPGVLLLLGTGVRGVFDVAVVDEDCGADGGQLLGFQRVP